MRSKFKDEHPFGTSSRSGGSSMPIGGDPRGTAGAMSAGRGVVVHFPLPRRDGRSAIGTLRHPVG